MSEPYLIQRAFVRPDMTREKVKGIDDLLAFDYMGSAEFEFGALPKSLGAILAELDSYKVFKTQYKSLAGVDLFVFCRESERDTVLGWVDSLVQGDVRLKESTYLADALGTGKLSRWAPSANMLPTAWWDIQNHWCAILGKPKAKWLKLAFEKVRAKRAK